MVSSNFGFFGFYLQHCNVNFSLNSMRGTVYGFASATRDLPIMNDTKQSLAFDRRKYCNIQHKCLPRKHRQIRATEHFLEKRTHPNNEESIFFPTYADAYRASSKSVSRLQTCQHSKQTQRGVEATTLMVIRKAKEDPKTQRIKNAKLLSMTVNL